MNPISIQSLSKSYGAVQALRDVSLEVSQSELFGFIGPDGAGKTTLMRILTTLIKPDKGEVKVLDLDVVRDFAKIRNKIGYMSEKFSLYQDLSVEENLQFFASLFGVKISDNYEFIAPIYRQIEPFKRRRAGKLSGGMKQKLALSCALVHRPEALFLDEPTRGVDPVSRKEFWQMLLDLKRQGITIAVSTSYMDEATLCDRVALCNEGRFLRVNTPQNLVNEFDDRLYALTGDDMYRTLMAARQFNATKSCYTFGDKHHILFKNNVPNDFHAFMHQQGIENMQLTLVEPNIEDCFMKILEQ